MVQKFIKPKYLTKEIAERAVRFAMSALWTELHELKRSDLHVVVLVPSMPYSSTDNPEWPNFPVEAAVLYEQGNGDPKKWEHPYDSIARSKAYQLWTGRNYGGAGILPHLMFSGETPFWGGVHCNGFVVTCSGVQPWFDRLVSGIVSDTMVALAHDAYENDENRKKGVDFLE